MGTARHAGQFSSENQPKRRRGKSKKGVLLEALELENSSEVQFWREQVVAAREGETAAASLIAQRLTPALRPMTQSVSDDIIPDNWLELSHTSRTGIIAYLVATGRMTIEQGLGLTTILASKGQGEIDLIMEMTLSKEAVDQCEKDRVQGHKRQYELYDRIFDNALKDMDRLKQMLQTGEESGDSLTTEPATDTDINNDTEVTTDE